MKKGFTLIELLVVIAIMGILTAVVLGSIDNANKRKVCDLNDTSCLKTQCAQYAESRADDVPAQCFKYFSLNYKTQVVQSAPVVPAQADCSQVPNTSPQSECRDGCYNIPNGDARSSCLDSCQNVPSESAKQHCLNGD